MRPITYIKDWGMVTDLGRRNISRMSAKLGVENIIIAADIALKRENIEKYTSLDEITTSGHGKFVYSWW